MKWILGLCLCASVSARTPEVEPSPEAAAKLEANGFVILDQPLRQGFSPYVDSTRPVFITSDSLLMAYHRIFEEYVGQAEAAQLVAFQDFWPALWKGLPRTVPDKPYEALPKGLRRARLIVATAHRLLTGAVPEGLTPEETAEVNAEAARVEKGEGNAPPPWVLPQTSPEDGVHYSVFLPAGLFEGNEVQERYYRFRKWLQEMAVDPADDSTLAMLGFFVSSYDKMGRDWNHRLDRLFAPCDFEAGLLRKLPDIAAPPEDPAELPNWHDHAKGRAGGGTRWRLGDVWLPPGSRITKSLLHLDPKLAPQTPEAVGLAFGNPLPATLLTAAVQESIRSENLTMEERWFRNPPAHYYDALRALNAPPDERTSALFRSEAWQRKQLNATLGSWTEFRYALQIGTREEVYFASMEEPQPGFVEPLPAFYHQLGASAEGLAMQLENFNSPRARHAVAVMRLQNLVPIMMKIAAAGGTETEEAFQLDFKIAPYWKLLSRLFPKEHKGEDEGWDFSSPEDCAKVAPKLAALLKSWWQGDSAAVKTLADHLAAGENLLGPRLGRLAATCFRLEAMAEHQLAGRPWEDYHKSFLESYGSDLGWLMFYEGNSYLSPKDDAPRIVRYATLVDLDGRTKTLNAAIARPRLFLINYPDGKGGSVLCQGSVYAFRNVAATSTPSHQEWITQSEANAWPEWALPIVGSHNPADQK